MTTATLGYGLTFADLASRDGLVRLDRIFTQHLADTDAGMHARLMTARAAPETLDIKDEGALLVDLGPLVEGFVAGVFGIEAEIAALREATLALDPVHQCKRLFVQRQAVRTYPDPSGFDGAALRAEIEALLGAALSETGFAAFVTASQGDAAATDLAARYAAWATLSAAGRAMHRGGTLFRVPGKVDTARLVPVETIERHGVTMLRLPEHAWRARDGFALTDAGMSGQQALDQMNYCIWCHEQGKDSCCC